MTNLLTEDLDEATFPEKFKDNDSGGLRVQALINSYKELEKMMGSRPSAPKSPDEYCIECEHGMFEPDAEVNARLYEKGFSQDQAQEVYNIAADKMVPMLSQMKGDFDADREVEKLMNHFGGAESWKRVSAQLLSFGQKNLPEDVLDNLSSTYEGVIALHKMMKGEEPSLKRESAPVDNSASEAELSSMMRDPKYWRDKDPSMIAKVTQGFQKIYGK